MSIQQSFRRWIGDVRKRLVTLDSINVITLPTAEKFRALRKPLTDRSDTKWSVLDAARAAYFAVELTAIEQPKKLGEALVFGAAAFHAAAAHLGWSVKLDNVGPAGDPAAESNLKRQLQCVLGEVATLKRRLSDETSIAGDFAREAAEVRSQNAQLQQQLAAVASDASVASQAAFDARLDIALAEGSELRDKLQAAEARLMEAASYAKEIEGKLSVAAMVQNYGDWEKAVQQEAAKLVDSEDNLAAQVTGLEAQVLDLHRALDAQATAKAAIEAELATTLDRLAKMNTLAASIPPGIDEDFIEAWDVMAANSDYKNANGKLAFRFLEGIVTSARK
jgi:hypothetical protein